MKTLGSPIALGLPDLAADLLSFALGLRRTKDPGAMEPLRFKIDELFLTLDTRARQMDVPQEHVQQAKYALSALLDEIVLNSSWAIREAWSGKPLQLEYFNDFAAGEEFYNKLERLRGSEDPKKVDILEVYYLCLALGFKGKYSDLQGMEKLKVLLDGLSREIARVRTKGDGEGLSPRWAPPDALPAMVREFPAWIVAVGCGGALLVVFLLLKALLAASAGSVSGALP